MIIPSKYYSEDFAGFLAKKLIANGWRTRTALTIDQVDNMSDQQLYENTRSGLYFFCNGEQRTEAEYYEARDNEVWELIKNFVGIG